MDTPVVAGLADELASRDQAGLLRERDELLVTMLRLKAQAKELP